MNSSYDVVICGAGLAGLCMARQLHLTKPSLKVALIDAHDSNIPKAAWKVGESTVEFGAHYLRDHLQLGDYLAKSHLPKRGLRFFLGDSQGAIKDRHEFGSAAPSPFLTYQLDRGILEHDLRHFAKEQGVNFLENCTVTAIEIQTGKTLNTVSYKAADGTAGTLACKWVIDASGRRRLLQTKFGLSLPSKAGSCSSAWFRMAGNIKVDDLVEPSEEAWHARVPEDKRYLSTNHFVGKGYWVWFIPLSGDATSIGIVSRDEIHPFNTYNTFAKALAWLRTHEPRLAEFIEGKEPIDFKVMRQYSYTSKKIFSTDGWACVGEAAVFSDPFYSPGLDFIGMTNTFAAHMIDQDLQDRLEPSQVDVYSRYVVLLNEQITRFTQHAYDYFADELVTAARVMWDVSAAWGYMCPQFFNHVMINPEKQAALRKATHVSYFLLASKMYSLLDQWLAARAEGKGRFSYSFFNYLSLKWLLDFRKGNLQEHPSIEILCAQHEANMAFFEKLIMAMFYLAVDDLYPDKLTSLQASNAFNISKLSLNPNDWNLSELVSERESTFNFRYIYDEIKMKLIVRQPSQQETPLC